MDQLVVVASLSFLCCVTGTSLQNPEVSLDDVAKTHFGRFEDFKNVDIPPENDEPENDFTFSNDGSGNYYFEYHYPFFDRYEKGELKNAGTDNEIQVVKGQYIDRQVDSRGVHIIRTIGYIADENGYRPFLISLQYVLSQQQPPIAVPGAPKGDKPEISAATLGSLVGGNIG